MGTILIAIDDSMRREHYCEQLAADDHAVVAAASYGEAVLAAQTEVVDGAAVIDCGLADRGGLRLLRELRAGDHDDLAPDLPVLALLGELGGELDLVRVFDLGADDVARQPVGYLELRCRLRSVLGRRSEASCRARRRRVGQLELDLMARTARVGETFVDLSRLEFDLAAVLSSDPGRAFTKRELMRDVWQCEVAVTSRTVDSHACRLRGKLAEAGGQYVAVRRGVGYSLLGPS